MRMADEKYIIIVMYFYNFEDWRGYYAVIYNFCIHFGHYLHLDTPVGALVSRTETMMWSLST